MMSKQSWNGAIIRTASAPAKDQLEVILQPQPCWSGIRQIAELLPSIVSRFESLTGGLWQTEALEALCKAIACNAECFDEIKGRVIGTNAPKVVIKEHPEHAAMLVLSRAETLSETIQHWVAITSLCTIIARNQLTLGQTKNRSGTLSQIDKAWRALR